MAEIGGVLLALLLLLGFWRSRRRRKVRLVGPTEVPTSPIGPDAPTRLRLIASSDVVRGALIGAFGPAWASKTTEEIGDDPALLAKIGPPEVDRVAAFLRLADRAKFASGEPEPPDGWEAWASGFVEGLAAGANPKSAGK